MLIVYGTNIYDINQSPEMIFNQRGPAIEDISEKPKIMGEVRQFDHFIGSFPRLPAKPDFSALKEPEPTTAQPTQTPACRSPPTQVLEITARFRRRLLNMAFGQGAEAAAPETAGEISVVCASDCEVLIFCTLILIPSALQTRGGKFPLDHAVGIPVCKTDFKGHAP
jgi:hypothetical protein